MIPLLLIRHGVTDWNALKRLQGRSDRHLSERGKTDVRNWSIPQEFRDYHCVSSPLIRARETARLLGKEPKIEMALTEMSWGDWEGENWQDLQASLGADVMSAHETLGLDFRPDSGESPREVQQRLIPWLTALDQPTLAVSHNGVMQALYSLASGWQMTEKAPIKFCHGEAHLFEVSSDQVSIGRMNIPLVTS